MAAMKRKDQNTMNINKDNAMWNLDEKFRDVKTRELNWNWRGCRISEADLRGGVKMVMEFPDSEGVLEAAIEDFKGFCKRGNIKVLKRDGYPIVCRLGAASEPEAYRLVIEQESCVLEAGDTEGIRRGLYYLMSEMMLCEGPFLKLGEVGRRPAIRRRLAHEYPIDIFEDELGSRSDAVADSFLSMLARDGVNGLLLTMDLKKLAAKFKVYTDKLLSMDYIDIENPEIQQEFSEIRQHQNGMGFGLPRLAWTYNGIITGFIQIILSVAMAFSLFTLKVPFSSALAFLDSPFAIIAVILVLLCSMFLSPYLSMTGEKIWAKATYDNNKSNRIFSFYFFEMINDNNRAKDIRIYDQKRLIDKGFAYNSEIRSWIGYSKYNAKYSALSTAVSYLSNGLIYLFVALKAFAGAFGVGGVVQYAGAVSQFGSGFTSVLTNIGTLINNNVFLDKSLRFLDIPNKKYQGTLGVGKRDDNEYEIEFHHVSFQYPGSNTYALKNLNMKLQIGRRMAVVGMNGSGKTTMIKLLCRLYDPMEGYITLNGIDIKKYNYDEYRTIFSVVFQNFKLLPFTLGQNVASSLKYDERKVLEALDKSGFSSRLDSMPQGIETYLYKNFEEDGVEISGGEAQKIALARALDKLVHDLNQLATTIITSTEQVDAGAKKICFANSQVHLASL